MAILDPTELLPVAAFARPATDLLAGLLRSLVSHGILTVVAVFMPRTGGSGDSFLSDCNSTDYRRSKHWCGGHGAVHEHRDSGF